MNGETDRLWLRWDGEERPDGNQDHVMLSADMQDLAEQTPRFLAWAPVAIKAAIGGWKQPAPDCEVQVIDGLPRIAWRPKE